MANGKKGFILYAEQIEIFEQLTDEQAGKLMKHIFKYVNDENPTMEDVLLKMAFTPIKLQLKRDLKKWENRAEASRNNGKKGGRPDLSEELISNFGKTIPRTPKETDHFFYIFKQISTGNFKVGETRDLFKRRQTIKVPVNDLQIIHFVLIDRNDNLKIENDFKNKFSQYNISGDWYDFPGGLKEPIEFFNMVEKPSGLIKNQPLYKKPVNVTVNDTVKGKVNVKEEKLSEIKISVDKDISKKEKKKTDPLFQPFKKEFKEKYESITESEFYWRVKDSVAINQLIKKVRHAYKTAHVNPVENPTDEQMLTGFTHILKRAAADKWIGENFEPAIISSKFNNLKINETTNKNDWSSKVMRMGQSLIDKEEQLGNDS